MLISLFNRKFLPSLDLSLDTNDPLLLLLSLPLALSITRPRFPIRSLDLSVRFNYLASLESLPRLMASNDLECLLSMHLFLINDGLAISRSEAFISN